MYGSKSTFVFTMELLFIAYFETLARIVYSRSLSKTISRGRDSRVWQIEIRVRPLATTKHPKASEELTQHALFENQYTF
jgi:hypothetical protein